MNSCKNPRHSKKFHLDCNDCVIMIIDATWVGNPITYTVKAMDKKGFIFEDETLKKFRAGDMLGLDYIKVRSENWLT